MSTDAVVSSQDVLRSIMQLRRQGVIKAVQELEHLEPNLAEFLLEETTTLHHLIGRLGGTARQLRQVDERISSLGLVLTLSMRLAHARLWQIETDEPTEPDVRGQSTRSDHSPE